MSTALAFKVIKSPVGDLKLVASAAALMAVLWAEEGPGHTRFPGALEDLDHPVLCRAESQLADYFAGTLRFFSMKLEFTGTVFQKSVWQVLLTIPHGETRSYRDIAVQIGNPKAVRAVGGALGRNPISIIAPCHRVLGSGGKLTGFAGGLGAKARLLELENAVVSKSSPL
jgi:methylated-DNA-[protein]-cysteine S-methyltransferase